MGKALLQAPDFLTALDCAKWLAKTAGLGELNSGVFLLGFAQCARIGALSTEYPSLSKRLDAIESFGISKGFTVGGTKAEQKSVPGMKMPLGKQMKAALASSTDIDGLLKALIDQSLTSPSTLNTNEDLLAAIQSEDGFAISNHYAYHLAHRHQLKEISAEALTAGAYIALAQGRVRGEASNPNTPIEIINEYAGLKK